MIEGLYVEDFESFLDWYCRLNPNEPIDMHEAMNIFFSLEDFEVLGV